MRVIRAGRLVDGSGAAVQHGQSVFVDDGRIVGIEPSGDTPADAEVIDAAESTLLPGLIDGHVHLVFSAGGNPLADLGVEDDQRLLLRAVAAARQAKSRTGEPSPSGLRNPGVHAACGGWHRSRF